jgi:N-acetylglutamate synthase-like GNAT family acetyltransferase
LIRLLITAVIDKIIALLYTISSDSDNDQLENLFHSICWRFNKKTSHLKEALLASDLVISALDDDILIGFANAFTDCGKTVYIHYLLVHSNYQGKGIGKEIMKNILTEFPNFKHMVLIASNDKIVFFKKCGFSISEGATAMEIRQFKKTKKDVAN